MKDKLETFLTERLDDYLVMLREMVAINSFTINPEGINALAKLTAAQFGQLGFSAETVQSIDHPTYGNHLVLTRSGTGPHRIGLVAHLDTVFSAEEEAQNNFHWREEGNRVYGPGTVDIKGGTVLIYMLLDGLRALDPELFESVTWVVLLNSAEERGAQDFQHVSLAHLGNDALGYLVFEGGRRADENYEILVRRKGMATFNVHVTGRASHAGTTHDAGANAIVQMADIVQKIAALTDYAQDLTFNVGTIQGGLVTNRVPHACTVEVEMRCYDKTVYDKGVAAMLALNGYSSVSSPRDGFPCTTHVELKLQTQPWPENEGSRSLFNHWKAAADELGFVALPSSRGGLSDGNFLWDKLPTLDALGPSGSNAHCSERSADGSKDQEYAERDSFVPKTMLNVLAVRNLIRSRD